MRATPLPPASLGCFAGVDFVRGRLFETSDVDEAREVCGRVFNPHRLRVAGPGQTLHAAMDHLPLGPMSLNRLGWGADVCVDPDRLGSYYLVSIPVRGTARFAVGDRAVDVSPRMACVISAPQRFRFAADAAFEQIVLRLERDAVDAAWAALAGRPAAAPVELEAALPVGGAAWRAIEPVLQLVAACARGEHAPAAQPHLHARLHDMLLTVLLLQQAPALRLPAAAVPAGAAAALVRRAQAWFDERLAAPVTLADAARAAGVSTRTLQAAFRAVCGAGPMQWLRERRLDAVRRVLETGGDPALRVTEVALAHGFGHLGEFAAQYRRRFGEPPSRTRARRR